MEDFFDYHDNFHDIKEVKSNLILGEKDRKRRKITIAIPTYKRPELLEVSLKSAVEQKGFYDFEVIVIDNDPDSTETKKVVEKFMKPNVFYYKNEKNVGLYSNWNRCIELAQGEYITILNDDDWLSEDYLSQCQKYLSSKVDGLYFKYNTAYEQSFKDKGQPDGGHRFMRLKGIMAREKKRMTLFDFFLGNKSAGTLGVIMRTAYLKRLGGYKANYFPSADYILHTDFCRNFRVYRINKKINYYRVAENLSAKQETLKIWEYLDTQIREEIIRMMGTNERNEKLLHYVNGLIRDNQIKGLIDVWSYKTDTHIKQDIRHVLLRKIDGLKYELNI